MNVEMAIWSTPAFELLIVIAPVLKYPYIRSMQYKVHWKVGNYEVDISSN